MWQVRGISKYRRKTKWPVVTIGMFDGVHLGHQEVLRNTIERARLRNGEAIAVTFDKHPLRILNHQSPRLITSLDHRLVLFERMGIDGTLILHFDRRLCNMSASEFTERVLIRRIGARGVMLGFDSSFGRGAEGNAEFLRSYQPSGRFEVDIVPPVYVGDEPVSSTTIREAILAGRLGEAKRMLGRRVSVLGTVVAGDGRGRGLGFPTANLDLHHEIRPPSGVYACWSRIAKRWYPSVTSIGPRPSFDIKVASGNVEVHFLDFRRNIYGTSVEVQFVRRLRNQKLFVEVADLKKRIAKDVERARRVLRASRP